MGKIFLIVIGAFSLFGFEKLGSEYLVQFGNSEAKFHAVEYYSFSCPKCLDFFEKEYPAIDKTYIKPGTLSFAFHPDPADLLTLQAMVCLERLPAAKKPFFLEGVIQHLTQFKNPKAAAKIMMAIMEFFDEPVSDLEDLEFLKKTKAFQDALAFVSQKDVIRVVPSIEIDGHLYKKLPSLALIDAHIHQKRAS